MALVTIDELQAGMTLAADLLSPQGRMLLPNGTVLEEQHLRICRIWGVNFANIQDATANTETGKGDQVDPEAQRASEELGKNRFALADHEQEITGKLLELFVNRQARQAIDGKTTIPAATPPPPAGADPARKLLLSDLQGAEAKLASLPSIYFQVQEAVNNPRSSAAYVAEVISRDSTLTAKLLKLANSAFYGYPQKIETLTRAVTIVGSRQLTSLAIGVSVVQQFQDVPEYINMESFWKHSLACGILARLLAGQCNRNLNEERFFVAGLLHDLGRLFVLKNYPQHALAALQASREDQELLVATENRLWGLNHALIAGELFRLWKFPGALELAVRHHHQPLKAQSPLEPGIIHLADILAHTLNLGHSGAWYVPPLEKEVWEMLNLPVNILPVLADATDRQLAEIFKVFFD